MSDARDPGRDTYYRDSSDSYSKLTHEQSYSRAVLDWCVAHAGTRVLDYGCACGSYCVELSKKGFNCSGVDRNEDYVRRALARGVDAAVAGERLPFADKSFDTVMLIEVLEHVERPADVLSEAVRVARANILITVPNMTEFTRLKAMHLTYEHMLEQDHRNFFTRDSLEELLRVHCARCTVTQEEPIYAHAAFPWVARAGFSLLASLGMARPLAYARLYARCLV